MEKFNSIVASFVFWDGFNHSYLYVMYVKNVAKPTQPKKNKLAPPNFLACLTETLNAFLLNYNALFLSILLSR